MPAVQGFASGGEERDFGTAVERTCWAKLHRLSRPLAKRRGGALETGSARRGWWSKSGDAAPRVQRSPLSRSMRGHPVHRVLLAASRNDDPIAAGEQGDKPAVGAAARFALDARGRHRLEGKARSFRIEASSHARSHLHHRPFDPHDRSVRRPAARRAGGAGRRHSHRAALADQPQFDPEPLAASLADYQIGHARVAELGGLRKRSADVPPEVNAFWNNRSFHNYADHALSAEFRSGLAELEAMAEERRVAIMCAEAVWWRCHRRIVADYLLARGREVFHLMGEGRVEPAKLTPGAVPAGEGLHYPG